VWRKSGGRRGQTPGGNEMNAFIESVQYSDIRTRYDENTFQRKESFKVSSPYPYAYGFIVGSNQNNEDCLDCYILTNQILTVGKPMACEPVFMIEVYEGREVDHKVIMKTVNYEVDNEELVENTIKAFITEIFSKYPEVMISFGRKIGKEETLRFIQSHMRE
jgi:inorganic pyrophosphatase